MYHTYTPCQDVCRAPLRDPDDQVWSWQEGRLQIKCEIVYQIYQLEKYFKKLITLHGKKIIIHLCDKETFDKTLRALVNWWVMKSGQYFCLKI